MPACSASRSCPLRLCCDANRLPLRSDAVPFVFCYEFLHHFPELTPVIRKIHRILAGGTFFFSEEPYHRPKLALFRQFYPEIDRRC